MAYSLKQSFIKFRWKLTKVQEFIVRGNIIMILHKNNNNNQGVFLELLVAANNMMEQRTWYK